LLAVAELRATLLDMVIGSIAKGLLYILIAATLWLILRKLNRIKPLKRKTLK